MYYLGAYLKKNPICLKIQWTCLYAISAVIIWSIEFFFCKIKAAQGFCGVASSYTSPITVLSAVSLFMAFSKLACSPTAKKVIRSVAPLSFSVYIIHYNKNLWPFLAEKVTQYAGYNVGVAIISVVLTAVAVYSVCILIDALRYKEFGLINIKEICAKLENKLDSLLKTGNP